MNFAGRFFLLILAAASVIFCQPLPRSTPEEQGVSSQAILNFLDAAASQIHALHSLMIVRNGKVVAEGWWAPYAAEHPHMLYSLSKSFAATAIGLAVEEGRLSLDDQVISFFPNEIPENPSDNLKAMRIRDLLRMTTGHQEDTVERITAVLTRTDTQEVLPQEKTWAEKFLSLPVEHKPGTHFRYNSGASYMLSAILQKVTGMTLMDYLMPRLFEPLGIAEAKWESNAEGINLGGWGLYLRTEEIAKFGMLYLQKGVWQGKRLLSENWVEAATDLQTSNGSNPESDWEQGYGFQFWRCRYGAYRGDGAFGQYCIVMPQQNAVIAITGGVRNMQDVLNLVWQHLLPGMGEEKLAEGAETNFLKKRLKELSLPLPQGEPNSPFEKQIDNQSFIFDDNSSGIQALKFKVRKKETIIEIVKKKGKEEIKEEIIFGKRERRNCRSSLGFPSSLAAACFGTWPKPNHFLGEICFYETPYILQLDLVFEENTMTCSFEFNVSFGESRTGPIRAIKK